MKGYTIGIAPPIVNPKTLQHSIEFLKHEPSLLHNKYQVCGLKIELNTCCQFRSPEG